MKYIANIIFQQGKECVTQQRVSNTETKPLKYKSNDYSDQSNS